MYSRTLAEGVPWVFARANQGGNAESLNFSPLIGEKFFYFPHIISWLKISWEAFPYLKREGHFGQLGWYRGESAAFVPYTREQQAFLY